MSLRPAVFVLDYSQVFAFKWILFSVPGVGLGRAGEKTDSCWGSRR